MNSQKKKKKSSKQIRAQKHMELIIQGQNNGWSK